MPQPTAANELHLLDRYWRAANDLSVGKIYLMANPLLHEPLQPEHIKPRLLGHWGGTTPEINFIYVHLNRIIRQRDVNLIYVCGPGHGGPGMVANTWLEGSYSEIYPHVSEDAEGMQRLFKQFSFPGGIPSHAAPETPGSINEGGEQGYSLSHAFDAALDHSDLIVPYVIGDGEAETGPLAASWHGIKFLNPVRDGAVLPILHLNGYKIANPTILGRASDDDLHQLFSGYGDEPLFVSGHEPEDLFDAQGRLKPELRALAPQGDKRMGASPYANGGLLHCELDTPDICDFAFDVKEPGSQLAQATEQFGRYLTAIFERNQDNFRLFGPDETASNRLSPVFDVTSRTWLEPIKSYDEQAGADGRVIEILSEHQCQGWLEGYLLTGRHGLFNCYEAFIHIVDSMFNQHVKWLKVTRKLGWRKPVASLNYLLSSHVWLKDHNGYSHQDPGFMDHVANKKADIVRIYLPPDANTLFWVGDHCLRTWDRINVIVAGKQPSAQWLDMESAIAHCEAGMGKWRWAGTTPQGEEPDVVMACAGDVPMLETLAAVDLLRDYLPNLRIRVVNMVNLMALQTQEQHPHGKSEEEFDALFTLDKPVIFAFHGYPTLVHRLTYQRNNHRNFHVRGFNEEGTTTTPSDMTVLNELDRYHLAQEAILRVSGLAEQYPELLDDLHCRSASASIIATCANMAKTYRKCATGNGRRRPARARRTSAAPPAASTPWWRSGRAPSRLLKSWRFHAVCRCVPSRSPSAAQIRMQGKFTSAKPSITGSKPLCALHSSATLLAISQALGFSV
ncbi:Xylulose-5-phosphate phosphoketolase|nr:Xylulose-5-phosphate phosphoketolase [Candidatus Pantoea persica]